MQGLTATAMHGVPRKRSKKRLKHTGNLFRKNLRYLFRKNLRCHRIKTSLNSRLKGTKIIGQRKAFYRQRIPESSSARKETVDIDIFVTSRNDDRTFMQAIRIRVQEKQQVKDQQFCTFIF